MMRDDFLRLYEKYQSGKCTPEEKLLLENYKDSFILENHGWTTEMGNEQEIYKELRTRLKREISRPAKMRKLKMIVRWSIAASIVLISGLSIFLINKERIGIGSEAIADFKLKFETSNGEKKRIMLPDGTQVMLNAGSSLSLSEDFGKRAREVSLIGEAFFDVKHQENKPFKVHTKDFNINVLGTMFNVKSYANDKSSEATLLRGLINMQPTGDPKKIITLKPSQKVTFLASNVPEDKLNPNTTRQRIAINRYTTVADSVIVETAWTKNRIEIQDQGLEEIANTLERSFDVQISIEDEVVGNYHYTATFTHENISEILTTLQKLKHFNYKQKGGRIVISK